MNIFPHFDTSTTCPRCGRTDDKPAVLIPIYGTGDGNLCEGMQVHVDCIDLTAYRRDGKTIFYQEFREKGGE